MWQEHKQYYGLDLKGMVIFFQVIYQQHPSCLAREKKERHPKNPYYKTQKH